MAIANLIIGPNEGGGTAAGTAARIAEQLKEATSAWCPDSGDTVEASAAITEILAAKFLAIK